MSAALADVRDISLGPQWFPAGLSLEHGAPYVRAH